MKIATITFHCSYNYGSVIQAWALQQYLIELGHQVTVIDFRSSDFENYKLLDASSIKSIVGSLLFLPKNAGRRRSFLTFQMNHLHLSKSVYSETAKSHEQLMNYARGFDAVICGSDQIWNLDCTKGVIGQYFLDFVQGSVKKIAYAPSLGRNQFESENYQDADKNALRQLLSDFNAISVRENSTIPIFQEFSSCPISEAIDPTLLLNAREYRKIENTLPKGLQENQYIFAYTLWPDENMKQYTERLARTEHLKIVYLSKHRIRYSEPSINLYGTSPATFLALIDKAKYVLANSFHATVFSILFEKAFMIFGTDKSTVRMRDLLEKLELSGHLIQTADITSSTPMRFDVQSVQKKLNDLRENSVAFLDQALS